MKHFVNSCHVKWLNIFHSYLYYFIVYFIINRNMSINCITLESFHDVDVIGKKI